MADFHAADLWVAVVPETSQVGPAMEKAGKEAKGRFGAAVKDFGKTIHDDLDKIGEKAKDSFSHAGTHAKDAFSKAGKMAGDAFNSELGKELQSAVGDEIGKAIGEAVKEIPGFATGAKYVQDFAAATKVATGALENVRDTIRATKVLDFNTALQGVENTLKSVEPIAKIFGVDISSWEGPLGDVREKSKALTDTYGVLKGNINDTAKGFTDLTNNSGRIAGGLNTIAAAAGPLAGTFAALDALMPGFDQHLNNVMAQLQGKQGFNIKDWINTAVPGTNLLDQFFDSPHSPGGANVPPPPGVTAPPNVPGAMGPFVRRPGNVQQPSDLGGLLGGGGGGPVPPPTTAAPASPGGGHSFYKDWYGPSAPAALPTPALPSSPTADLTLPSSSSGGGAGGSGYSRPSIGSPSTRQGVAAAGSQVANLYAFAQSLVGTPYSQALRNDCSGMVAKLANVAVGLPPAASFSTVNEGQWLMSHGFEPGLGGPNDFNIGWYDHGGGNAGHTAATLPGGIHAESGGSHGSFALGPGAAGAENPEFTQHAHLSMGSLRGGGAAAGQMPTGAEHDPLYVTQTSGGAGGSSGGSNTFQSQGQQLGQGLMNGVLQMFGIDGSVFGGKSPLDWGAVKLGGGLLNWGLGTARSMGGAPMGTPGGGGGGGGGLLGGLAGLIPQPGPMVSAAAGPGGGSYGVNAAMGGGGPVNIHHDQSINVTANGPDPYAWLQPAQIARNAQRDPPRSNSTLSGVPQ